MKFCSLLAGETQAFMSCNVFFSSWNQNRKQVVSSPQHCDWSLLVAICTNIFGTQFLQSLDGAYVNSGKTKRGKCFPRFFLQSQFQGGRRPVLFRNSNFDPISWFKVFLHEQPCKIWCLLPLFKRGGTDTFFPPSNLTTFYRFLFPQLYYRGKN